MVSWVGRCGKQTRFVRPLAACLPLPPKQAAGHGPPCLPLSRFGPAELGFKLTFVLLSLTGAGSLLFERVRLLRVGS